MAVLEMRSYKLNDFVKRFDCICTVLPLENAYLTYNDLNVFTKEERNVTPVRSCRAS